MSEYLSEKLSLLRLDNESISLLGPSSKEKHEDIFHPDGFLMLLLQTYCLVVGLLERISG